MKKFYASSTRGFYSEEIHGTPGSPDCKIPSDAVEITGEYYAALLDAQFNGKRIEPDAKGFPVAVDPPAPTLEDIKATKNAEINAARLKANRSTFPFGDKLIQCDELSRSDIDAVAMTVARTGALPAEFPGGWKALDNSIVPIPDVATWDAFYGAMVDQGTANFNKAQALKGQLKAAKTPEEVEAITW